MLTDDAGDELFLGYDKYAVDYYANIYKGIPKLGRKLIEFGIDLFPDMSVTSRKLKKVINNVGEDPFVKRTNLMKLGFKDEEVDRLLSQKYLKILNEDIVRETFDSAPRKSELSRTQYTDIKIVLEGDMLTKVDRMTMLNSIESRTPMLAVDAIEFAYSIPNNYKLDGKNKKKILKETFSDLLPKGYEKQPKRGFGIPLDYWFRNEMRSEIMDLLSPDRIKNQGIFDSNYVEKILSEHMSGRVNRKSELWLLYVFEKWIERMK